MSEWDSLQDDGGLWGCENTLYQEVARLREALARTEDELGSFYRFGDEYSVLSDENSEEDLLDVDSDNDSQPYSAHHVDSGRGGDHAKHSDPAEVRLVNQCLIHNQQFQERVKTRLALINAHLSDIYVKMNKLEELKVNAESGARVKVGFCLSGFYGCPYFSDEGNRGPPANSDVKRNLQSPATLMYRNLKNYKSYGDVDRAKVEKDKDLLKQIVVKQCLELLLDPLMAELHRTRDSSRRATLKEKMKRMEKLSDEELAERIGTDGIDWNKVAMTAFGGEYQGAYCRQLWVNAANPLLNTCPWSKQEDKRLLSVAKRLDYRNWREISEELKTNRTPIQCLSRYQIHLNPNVSNNIWDPDEDQKLAEAVNKFGEGNWSLICSELGGRTADQCIQRWTRCVRTQHSQARRGKWSSQEDQELKNAVSKFGQQWVKVAKVVQTRNDRQCRERWCNVLDPDLSKSEWSHNEDQKLMDLCQKHQNKDAIKWSMVAREMVGRTDAQCRQRYLTMQSHPQAIEYVKQHKKTMLFQRRNKRLKIADVFAGDKSELIGTDVEDDILSQKEQEQVGRFASRLPASSTCPQCFSEPDPPADIGCTLPPCGVYFGAYHSTMLTAIGFASVDTTIDTMSAPTYTLDRDIDTMDMSNDTLEMPANTVDTPTNTMDTPTNTMELSTNAIATPTNTVETFTDTMDMPTNTMDMPTNTMDTPTNTTDTPTDSTSTPAVLSRNLEQWPKAKRKKLSTDVKLKTIIVYQEFARPPPPKPYSPVRPWYSPCYTPLAGIVCSPTHLSTVQFPTPHLVDPFLCQQHPIFTQFLTPSDEHDGSTCQQPFSSKSSIFMSPPTQIKLHELAKMFNTSSNQFCPVTYENNEPPLTTPFSAATSLAILPHDQYFCSPTPSDNVVMTPQPPYPMSEQDCRLEGLLREARAKEMDPDAILSAVGPLYGLRYTGTSPALTQRNSPILKSTYGDRLSASNQRHTAPLDMPTLAQVDSTQGPNLENTSKTRQDTPTSIQQDVCDSPSMDTATSTDNTTHPAMQPTQNLLNISTKKRSKSSSITQPSSSLSTWDMEAAVMSCELPSSQFSTLLQAWQVSSPLTLGGQLKDRPNTVPVLPPSAPTLSAFQKIESILSKKESSLEVSSRESNTREFELLRERFCSLFTWPALLKESSSNKQSKGKGKRRKKT